MVTDLFILPLSGGGPLAGDLLLGPENRLAMAAAARLAGDDKQPVAWDSHPEQSVRPGWESQATASPLVLYGPSGVGKTHLALGLAARWEEEKPDDRVAVITGSDYARQYADACKADAVEDFAQRLRHSDLLVMDTLCELAGKTAAQQHLVRTLDVVHDRGGTAIVTLRHCPGTQKTLIAPLVSRLLGGLPVAMLLPSEATRAAISQYWAGKLNVQLDEAANKLLARRLQEGAAQIHTVISQLAAGASESINKTDVENLLCEEKPTDRPTLPEIAALTARRMRVSLKDLRSPSRCASHVRARGVAMLAARRLAEMPYGRIGAYFGGRDHTTVMHACQKTEQRLAVDHQLADVWQQLMTALGDRGAGHQTCQSDVTT